MEANAKCRQPKFSNQLTIRGYDPFLPEIIRIRNLCIPHEKPAFAFCAPDAQMGQRGPKVPNDGSVPAAADRKIVVFQPARKRQAFIKSLPVYGGSPHEDVASGCRLA